jgi:hypothetical protein
MAYSTNSIGSYQFVAIRGAIFYRQVQLEVFNRPGVDGSGLRRLGARGKPFDLITLQFHADETAAKTALQTYQTVPGTVALTLTRRGVNHGDYQILEVDEVATVPVLNPSGNANSAYTSMQTCRWKLLG